MRTEKKKELEYFLKFIALNLSTRTLKNNIYKESFD